MTFLTTTTGAESILPEEYAALVTGPVTKNAVAFHEDVATTVPTASHEFKVPVLKEDAGAEWVEEGAEISSDDPVLEEITIQPKKVAGLTIISRELAEDSAPAAQELVGQSIARSIINQIDRAYLGNLPAPAPAGLGSLSTSQAIIDKPLESLDGFVAAVGLAEQAGANVTAFLVSPGDATKIGMMKDTTGSNRPLLENPRTILDRPVIVNKHITDGTIWAVDRAHNHTVLREGTTLAVSDGPYFTSDRIAIRATMRVGFGFPIPNKIVKITHTA